MMDVVTGSAVHASLYNGGDSMSIAEANEVYFRCNRSEDKLAVGASALELNKLMWGGYGIELYTDYEELHHVRMGAVYLEHYHFSDRNFCQMIDTCNRVWLPSAERSLVDTITFLDYNYIEGPLIESLQNYIRKHGDLSELRKVADFYKLPQETLDYWINEALEETDMSMG